MHDMKTVDMHDMNTEDMRNKDIVDMHSRTDFLQYHDMKLTRTEQIHDNYTNCVVDGITIAVSTS